MPGPGCTTEDWCERTTSTERAVSALRPGDRVFVGTACATPRTLVDALEQRSRHRVFYVGVFGRGDHRTDVESSGGTSVATMPFEGRGSAETS